MNDAERYAETMAMHWAFLHVYHEDHANAAMHAATVRFSPITFRLAECLSTDERMQDLAEQGWSQSEVARVIKDQGRYDEDRGR